MKEYTGPLVGGPDPGNSVSASVANIPTIETVELWLDGKGEDKAVTVSITKGAYVWNRESSNFKWNLESIHYYTQKPVEPESV